MNRISMIRALTLSSLLAMPAAWAGTTMHTESSTHQSYLRIDDDSLVQHKDNRTLQLRDGHDGIVVEAADPAPLLGLIQGDVIVGIDGHAIAHITQLRAELDTLDGRNVQLSVRGGNGALRTLSLSRHDYGDWLPPPPPAAPVPPSPPMPPVR